MGAREFFAGLSSALVNIRDARRHAAGITQSKWSATCVTSHSSACNDYRMHARPDPVISPIRPEVGHRVSFLSLVPARAVSSMPCSFDLLPRQDFPRWLHEDSGPSHISRSHVAHQMSGIYWACLLRTRNYGSYGL